jgi:hypothetical protein
LIISGKKRLASTVAPQTEQVAKKRKLSKPNLSTAYIEDSDEALKEGEQAQEEQIVMEIDEER